MLKENTGKQLLDSGGAYGRNWEKNQEADFDKTEPVEVEVHDDGVSITYNLYHFMLNQLELDEVCEKLQEEFDKFSEKSDSPYLADMEEFIEKKGFSEAHTFNSYNGDNLLSQVIQGITFEADGEDYVLLQVHGGCDVRGGYTAPIFFKIEIDSFILSQVDVNASCGCKAFYSDDCGYHWYNDKMGRDEEKYKLPKEWKPKDNKLVCTKCKKEIYFSCR